jgi:hypothetical protein
MIELAVLFLIIWIFVRHPLLITLSAVCAVVGVILILTNASVYALGW